jgi:hypothetical protein
MKIFAKIFWVVVFFYIISSSLFYIQTAFQEKISLRFLYPDATTVLRVQEAEGHYTGSLQEKISRVFYNKPFGYMQTYTDSLYRSIDIPFLFSLTTMSSMYDDQGKINMLFPIELPFFLLAAVALLRSSNKNYRWLFIVLIISISFTALLLPSLEKLKLFPEVLTLRLIIVFGLYEGVKNG